MSSPLLPGGSGRNPHSANFYNSGNSVYPQYAMAPKTADNISSNDNSCTITPTNAHSGKQH